MKTNIIHNCDCMAGLRELPDNSVDCCVTSPPYYALRDYGCDGQIGLEQTPEEYIAKLVIVFREVRRVLKPEGTCWVNMGDSYAGSMKGGAGWPENAMNYKQGTNRGSLGKGTLVKQSLTGIKNKDLIGIPWMLAFALRTDGWYLRQDIIWAKPNPMPESVRDRCTKAHEYIFLLSKSKRYYFDNEAIKQPAKESTLRRVEQDVENQEGSDRVPCKTNGRMKAVIGGRKRENINDSLDANDPMHRNNTFREYEYTGFANKRSVWEVPTIGMKEAHFATYPEKLIVDCIKAGCPEKGIVLDPFMGSGTTAIVAGKLGRQYIGYELNSEYLAIAERRIRNELGMFSQPNAMAL